MSKQTKSQWDFGELFPAEATRKVFSVGELTGQIRGLLERHVGLIWVNGEITNLRAQNSGHIYFTLKDPNAQIACVLFRGEMVPHRELIADGQKVLLQGNVTVYEARGQYQLVVRSVELQGAGTLQIAFEKLKQKLAAEGLFAPERKRPLPKYPQRIGLITSPTGAAIRDVLHVVRRRNPSLEILLVPCCVQGDSAGREIAAAIRLLNEFNVAAVYDRRLIVEEEMRRSQTAATNKLDLILLTRGGGSLEDLWAFNEEIVARAIFESALPVVSAIGHEIDFTIADFVADVRAATPSAGAEIITEDVFSSREFVAEAPAVLRRKARQCLENLRADLNQFQMRLTRVHPRRRLDEFLQRLDDLQNGLARCTKQGTKERKVACGNLAARLLRVRPAQLLRQRQELLESSRRRLLEMARAHLRDWQSRCSTARARLGLLGPEQVLSRGYSITMDASSGAVLHDASKVKVGQKLKTRLKTGELLSRVG